MLSPQYKDKDEVWFLVVINELLFLYRVTQERSSQLAVHRKDLLVVVQKKTEYDGINNKAHLKNKAKK